jgi:hypothetical protein
MKIFLASEPGKNREHQQQNNDQPTQNGYVEAKKIREQ